MGLSEDLYQAFIKNMQDADSEQIELTSFQQEKARELADNIKEAVVDFLVKQTFTIKKMTAALEVESIKTSTNLNADIRTTVGIAKGIPVGGGGAGVTVATG